MNLLESSASDSWRRTLRMENLLLKVAVASYEVKEFDLCFIDTLTCKRLGLLFSSP